MKRLNDGERRLWVENDEPLYLWWREWSRKWRNRRKGMPAFVRENRAEIDEVIGRRLGGGAR